MPWEEVAEGLEANRDWVVRIVGPISDDYGPGRTLTRDTATLLEGVSECMEECARLVERRLGFVSEGDASVASWAADEMTRFLTVSALLAESARSEDETGLLPFLRRTAALDRLLEPVAPLPDLDEATA